MISTLETIQVPGKDRKAVYVLTQPGLQRAEAPNWSADNWLYFNNRGKMLKIKADLPASTPPTAVPAAPVAVDLGLLTNINNDHDISPDGKLLAVSDQSQGNRQSAIWVLPIEGAAPSRPGGSPRMRLLFSRLEPGRQDARLLRETRQRLQYLHDLRPRGAEKETHELRGQGRRSRIHSNT